MFNSGNFTLNSGKKSTFKIDCDDLEDSDWATFALLVARKYTYGAVEGVPTGGIPFANALKPYVTPGAPLTLIVDDVLTTGGSMEKQRAGRFMVDQRSGRTLNAQPGDVKGIVVFARTFTPMWIDAIFSSSLWFDSTDMFDNNMLPVNYAH